MVSIGRVWDRTTQVLGGRGSTLAGIAALTILLPTIVRAGYAAYVPPTPAAMGIGSLIAILVLLATIWGQLAIVALSSDPDNTRGSATAIATRRLPLAIGIILVIGIVGTLLVVPALVAIAPALNPMAIRLMQAGIMPNVAPGAMLFVSLYLLVLAIAFFVVCARLMVLNAVIVNERAGFGSILRAFRVTHGLTWKLIGVTILYVIVLLVAMGAAQAVTGIVFRLILGPNGIATATFLAAIAGAIVTTAMSVVATVFATQLYVTVTDTASPA